MAFPSISSTPLDNFNRANESVLSGGGNWAALVSGGTPLRLDTNAVCSNDTVIAGQSYWTPTNFQDPESYVTASTLPSTDGHLLARLFGRITGEGGAAGGQSYYRLAVIWRSAAAAEWTISKTVSGTNTSLVGPTSQAISAGDKIGFSVIGDTLTSYIFTSGSWSQVNTVSGGAAVTGAGKIALATQAQVVRLDDFVGGNATPPTQDQVTLRVFNQAVMRASSW